MAKMTLKGVFVDRGEFVKRETGESIPYNNLMLVGLCDFSLPSGTFSVGEMYETVKIKKRWNIAIFLRKSFLYSASSLLRNSSETGSARFVTQITTNSEKL